MKKIKQWTLDWWLIGILVLAAFLYSWNIWEAGNANDYYTAAITSMIQSWHNFWYGAFDPAGFITVDKPPVALLVHGHFRQNFRRSRLVSCFTLNFVWRRQRGANL